MVHPIHPSDSLNRPSEPSRQERQKILELQFEIGVISSYVAVSGQNGSVRNQLSQLKNGLASGQSPDQLASNINQLIFQINSTIDQGKAHFPSFHFSTGESQVQAITHFVLSLEKFLNVAGEKGSIDWSNQEKLFGELSNLVYNVGQMTPEQAFGKLNTLIEQTNNVLPAQYRLPKIT